MRRILTALGLAAAFILPAAGADYGTAYPPVIGYHHHHYAALPLCDDPAVVATIPERFRYQDARLTMTGLAVTGVDGIHEHALKAGGPGLVDRRFCGGTAWLSNGRKSEVVYLIEGPKLGFASIGWHVESCVVGHDPWRVYDAGCRAIEP